MPLELRLRGKSTTQSHRAPIYYADMIVRTGASLAAAITQALSDWDLREATGFNQAALDAAARAGLALGAFEESVEDAGTVIEEFFSEDDPDARPPVSDGATTARPKAALGEKLSRKLSAVGAERADHAT